MILYPEQLESRQCYKIATGLIVPRPIAWVSTVDADGTPNVAPFSYFTVASSDPLTLLFCPGRRSDGTQKDSWRNAEASGEFVVNICNEETAAAMNASAADFAPGVSEFSAAGVTAAPSKLVAAPRVAEAPAAFECRLTQIVAVGSSAVLFGQVAVIHISDAVYDGDYIDIPALRPIGRLAGAGYTRVTDLFEMVRITDPDALG